MYKKYLMNSTSIHGKTVNKIKIEEIYINTIKVTCKKSQRYHHNHWRKPEVFFAKICYKLKMPTLTAFIYQSTRSSSQIIARERN